MNGREASQRENNMKAVRLGVLALLASAAAAPALAADMPVKARPMPAVVAMYNWSGVYIGGNVGYSWGRSETDVSYFTNPAGAPITPPAGSLTSARTNLDGWLAGGQIGANWQFGQWLFGVEADAQWSGQRGSSNFLCAATVIGGACVPGVTALPAGVTGTALGLSQDLEWFGTARLRLGWLPTQTLLLYATGGLAFGEVETSGILTSFTACCGVATVAGTISETKLGWTVGAGIEGVISGPWTAKLEYLYMDLGSVSGSFVTPTTPGIRAAFSSDITDHILRVGLNYRFMPTGMSRM
jgi:outer membrane immunogenic protein